MSFSATVIICGMPGTRLIIEMSLIIEVTEENWRSNFCSRGDLSAGLRDPLGNTHLEPLGLNTTWRWAGAMVT